MIGAYGGSWRRANLLGALDLAEMEASTLSTTEIAQHATLRRKAAELGRSAEGRWHHDPRDSFRPDIEGLRGIAVAAVLLYHGAKAVAPGGYAGVDVFFVISGFLITGMLTGEMSAGRSISLVGFYSRRAKRLLPLVAVVLACIAVVSGLLLSPLRQERVAGGVVAAGLYVINWQLASRSVDYSAATMHASPVQHFWSLSVEEQFYIVWPAMLLAATWWWRRRGKNVIPPLTMAVCAVAIASFLINLHVTHEEAAAAYFSTPARGWELALGGLLALAGRSRLRIRPGPAFVLGAAGLGAIVSSLWLLDDSTPFPGTAALLPVLGSAAVIAAGFTRRASLPTRLLALRPLRHVGRISYAWYLWHWPFIVFAVARWGRLSPIEGMIVIAISYLPTVATHRLVERPLHHSKTLSARPRLSLALGGALTSCAVLAGLALFVTVPRIPVASGTTIQGAAALHLAGAEQPAADALAPPPDKAYDDRGEMFKDGCLVPPKGDRSPSCIYGDRTSGTTVVLFGDSHAIQYSPALNVLSRRHGWRLVGLAKAGCTPALAGSYESGFKRRYSECDTWRRRALSRISHEHPAMVVVSSLATYRVFKDGRLLDRAASAPLLEAAYEKTLRRLRSIGAEVVVIRDGPHPGRDVPDCVSRFLHDLLRCATDRSAALDYPPVDARAARSVPEVRLVNPVPELCTRRICPAVIGNVLVYRNTTHLTATYVRTMAGWLDHKLPDLAGN